MNLSTDHFHSSTYPLLLFWPFCAYCSFSSSFLCFFLEMKGNLHEQSWRGENVANLHEQHFRPISFTRKGRAAMHDDLGRGCPWLPRPRIRLWGFIDLEFKVEWPWTMTSYGVHGGLTTSKPMEDNKMIVKWGIENRIKGKIELIWFSWSSVAPKSAPQDYKKPWKRQKKKGGITRTLITRTLWQRRWTMLKSTLALLGWMYRQRGIVTLNM